MLKQHNKQGFQLQRSTSRKTMLAATMTDYQTNNTRKAAQKIARPGEKSKEIGTYLSIQSIYSISRTNKLLRTQRQRIEMQATRWCKKQDEDLRLLQMRSEN